MAYINGPVNIIRLVGTINGMNKEIYLFGDVHMDLYDQTECENIDAIDIDKYFLNLFKDANESKYQYDFLLESGLPIESKYKQKYIGLVMNLTKKVFKYHENKNIVNINKDYKNVRLHFIDIRDYLTRTVNNSNIYIENENLLNLLNKIPSFDDIRFISNSFLTIHSCIIILKTALYSDKTTSKERFLRNYEEINKLDYKKNYNIIKHIMDKLRNRYQNKEIKNFINSYLDGHIKKTINELSDYFIKTADRLNKNQKNFQNKDYDDLVEYNGKKDYLFIITGEIYLEIQKIKIEYIEMYDKLSKLLVEITDLYLLRRLLDKDYIRIAITYTGDYHTFNYINILMNKFNFKITNASYSSIEKVENIKGSQINTFEKYISIFSRPKLLQCSDISDFPPIIKK